MVDRLYAVACATAVKPFRNRKKEKPRRSGAFSLPTWRREPESNRPKRLCRPLHNRFAIAPKADCSDAVKAKRQIFYSRTVSPSNKKGSVASPLLGAGDESRTRDLNLGKVALYQLSYSRIVLHLQRFAVPHAARKIWSGRRVSNSRPQPWQGCALPTELLPHAAALLLPRHTLTSSCSGEARLCRRHIRVSRAFPALFPKNLVDRTRDTHHAPPRSRICGQASFM